MEDFKRKEGNWVPRECSFEDIILRLNKLGHEQFDGTEESMRATKDDMREGEVNFVCGYCDMTGTAVKDRSKPQDRWWNAQGEIFRQKCTRLPDDE